MKPRILVAMIACALSIWLATLAIALPLSTAFTYQGQLIQSGNPVTGTADFQFTLWDALSGSLQVGGPIAVNNVSVSNGQFTVAIDFGSNVFNGDARWLQIAVRSPAGSGTFTTLTPRQALMAVPYALQTRGMFVDNAGNVGISTTNTGSLLTVGSPVTRGTLNVVGSASAIPVLSLTDSRPGGHQYSLYSGLSGIGSFDIFHQNSASNRFCILSSGRVGIGTITPNEKLTVAGSMEIGTSAGDYQHLRIGGGNSSGFLYGSFPAFADGIHMGYNYYADGAGAGHVANTGGETSRISMRYGSIALATGLVNQAPRDRFAVDGEGTMYQYRTANSEVAAAQFTDPPTGTSTYPGGTPTRSAGSLYLYGPAGRTRFGVRSRFNVGNPSTYFPNQAEMFMEAADGTKVISIYCTGEGGAQGSSGNILCSNFLATGSKNFIVPNPENPKEDLTYACLEGPECGIYLRGTTQLKNGQAHVNLPATFSSLASQQGMTVILTPLSGESRGLACVNRSINGFDVVELMQGAGSYEFDWEIKAIRRGTRDYQVVHPWTEHASGGKPEDELWRLRMADIDRRNARYAQEDVELGPRPNAEIVSSPDVQ